MANYLTNTEDLTTVANAIRTKGGTAAQLSFPNGMAQAIADIPTGGSSTTGPSAEWDTRPKDAPNLDLLDLTNFLGFYFSLDVGKCKTMTSDYTFDYNISVTSNVYRGHIGENNSFVSDETLGTNVSAGLHSFNINKSWPDYVVIKIEASAGFKVIGLANPPSVGFGQFCIELIGKSTKAAGRFEYNSIVGAFIRLKLISFNISYLYDNINRTKGVEVIQLVDFDWTTSSTGNIIAELAKCNTVKRVEIKNQDISSWKNMSFRECFNLKDVDFTGSRASLTTAEKLFYKCPVRSIKGLDDIFYNPENITSMILAFSFSCACITELVLRNKNFSSCTNVGNMLERVGEGGMMKRIDFSGCSWPLASNWGTITDYNGWDNVEYFRIGEIFSSINFHKMTGLAHDNLVEILNDLGEVDTSQTVTMGATNVAKLSAAEIAVAIAKGWTVA